MTGMPPSSLATIATPTLADFIVVANTLPAVERRQWCALSHSRTWDPDHMALRLASSEGPKWVLLKPSGEPLAIGGFNPLHPGVWREWMIATSECWEKYAFTTTRYCKRAIEQMLVTSAHRIECISLAEKTTAHDWYRVLGFRAEGTLKKYGANGEDCIVFARTDDAEES